MIKLYKHQQQALEATKNLNKVAYYLDMGLGKTYVGAQKLYELNNTKGLVVCQKTKIADWVSHMQTHYAISVYDLTIKKQLDEFMQTPQRAVGIINYDLVWRRPQLASLEDFTLMLDESSLIQHTKSKKTKFILAIKPKGVILLSGTPVGGKYENLWTQLKLLGYGKSENYFLNTYVNRNKLKIGGHSVWVVDKKNPYKNTGQLKQLLRNRGAVFMKTSEVFDLPPQVDQHLGTKAPAYYLQFMRDSVVEVEGKTYVGSNMLTKLTVARQLCGGNNRHKTEVLVDLLVSTNQRVVIFYNFNQDLENLKTICHLLDRPTSIVNGQTHDLSSYHAHSDSVTLVQYKAGSKGINLQEANHMVFYTPPLSSEDFEQAKKRIHRIGQQQSCFYYYLTALHSVEEDIYKTLAKRKDYTNELFKNKHQSCPHVGSIN